MRFRHYMLLTVIAFVVAVGAFMWLRSSEVIVVRAVDSVRLYDPNTLAGAIGDKPKQVGALNPGEEIQVAKCVDRKSDFNLIASYQGQSVAVGEWEAKVILLRRNAYPWEQGATTSCQGLFENVSKRA